MNQAQYYILFIQKLVVRYINATSLELPHKEESKNS